MARNRIIKPEFWADAKVGRLSFGARLLYIAMWNFADDYGTISASPRRLLGDAFENDESVTLENVVAWLREIEAQGMIEKYTAKEKDWYEIRTFSQHQKGFHKSERRNPARDNETLACDMHASCLPNGNGNDNGNEKENGNGAQAHKEPAFFSAEHKATEQLKIISAEFNLNLEREIDRRPRAPDIVELVRIAREVFPIMIGAFTGFEAARHSLKWLRQSSWHSTKGFDRLEWLLDVRNRGQKAAANLRQYSGKEGDYARKMAALEAEYAVNGSG